MASVTATAGTDNVPATPSPSPSPTKKKHTHTPTHNTLCSMGREEKTRRERMKIWRCHSVGYSHLYNIRFIHWWFCALCVCAWKYMFELNNNSEWYIDGHERCGEKFLTHTNTRTTCPATSKIVFWATSSIIERPFTVLHGAQQIMLQSDMAT